MIGDREVKTVEHFSPVKKLLQRLGSWVVRRASETTVPDTTSGFRAYNREAALQVQVVSRFTYTLETVIQAGKMLRRDRSRPDTDESEDARIEALQVDLLLRSNERRIDLPDLCDVRAAARLSRRRRHRGGWSRSVVWGRFLILFIGGEGEGHVQSVVLGAMLFVVAVQLAALGVIGDLLANNRVLIQRALERTRRIELKLGVEPSHYEPRAPAYRGRRGRRRASATARAGAGHHGSADD